MTKDLDRRLSEEFFRNHPNTAVLNLEGLNNDDLLQFIEDLEEPIQRKILAKLNSLRIVKLLKAISLERCVYFVSILNSHDAEMILRSLDPALREEILLKLETELSAYLRNVLSYASQQVGAHIDSERIYFYEDLNVGSILEALKKDKYFSSGRLFLLDKSNKVSGYIVLTDLLKISANDSLKTIMNNLPPSILATMSIKDALDIWDDDFTELPVVKADGRYVGMVSRKQLAELLEPQKAKERHDIKAGNALWDLYSIGLTSLLGGSHEKN